jgi:hypothetical protein
VFTNPVILIRAVPQAARPLHRLTVFHPAGAVSQASAALPGPLPTPCCTIFTKCLSKTGAARFPQTLLASLVWQTCPSCGLEHGRAQCPHCAKPQVTPIDATGAGAGDAGLSDCGLHPVRHPESGAIALGVLGGRDVLPRGNWHAVVEGDRLPHLRWQIQGDRTWLGYDQQLVEPMGASPGNAPTPDCGSLRGSRPSLTGGDNAAPLAGPRLSVATRRRWASHRR